MPLSFRGQSSSCLKEVRMMADNRINEISHHMTEETMTAFVENEKARGASDNMIRRFTGAVKVIYDYLPEDKCVTKERLLAWRVGMEEKGYSQLTVQNYVKYVNRYLDFVGCPEIRFNRGKAKNIQGMEFGFLTALEPTEKRDRKDVVWLCECRCGKRIELPATRLITHNTLSCGCILKEHMSRANQYIDSTSLRQSLDETVISTRSESGYVGVTKKRGKWQAQITYKRKRYNLGTYSKLEDAVKARARGKALILDDAMSLKEIYEALHKDELPLPKKGTEPKQIILKETVKSESTSSLPTKRTDNTSGQTGVHFRKEKWEARICHNGLRYMLGRFERIEDAVAARKKAEELLLSDPDRFVELYSEKARIYKIKK